MTQTKLANSEEVFHSPFIQRKLYLGDFIAGKVIKLVAFTCLAAILLIFVFVFREALPIFYRATVKAPTSEAVPLAQMESYGDDTTTTAVVDQQSLAANRETSGGEGNAGIKNLTSTQWQPVSSNPKYGLLPLFLGSFKVTLIAILLAGPIGIFAALYTSSFAPKWLRELLKPAIEILAGFPSVVIGFFSLIVLASIIQTMFGIQYRLNAFVGGVALAIAVIPIVFTITEDALAAVPRSYFEASLALGATKWQTVLFVILPAALPGVLAALILGFGRAFGETMIVLMATGNAALISANPFEPVRTMSATIGAEMAEVVFGDTHYTVLFLIGSLLFLFTFALNALAEFYVRGKLLKKFRGA